MNKNIVFGPENNSIITVHSAGYPDTSKPRLHAKNSGFIFEYVLSGEMCIESPDFLIHAGIDDLVIIHPSEECVMYRHSGDLKTLGFTASGFMYEAMYDVLALPRVFCASADILDKLLGVGNTFEKYSGGDCNSGRTLCELAVSLILDAVDLKGRNVPMGKPSAEAIKEYLDLCLCGDTDLESIGKKFGISGMHVIRLFRAKYDTTPMQYLKIARLEKSAKLLRKTKMSIKDVSSLLRFSSTQHFTNLFREHFGVSPGRFREKKPKR